MEGKLNHMLAVVLLTSSSIVEDRYINKELRITKCGKATRLWQDWKRNAAVKASERICSETVQVI